mmetsp:Transcript_24372/g.63295  ORF Transcript_24372/g.63295 Transcript_24372/m.63295 type:complete len:321 (+) Transcript_24372:3140-4102(+)
MLAVPALIVRRRAQLLREGGEHVLQEGVRGGGALRGKADQDAALHRAAGGYHPRPHRHGLRGLPHPAGAAPHVRARVLRHDGLGALACLGQPRPNKHHHPHRMHSTHLLRHGQARACFKADRVVNDLAPINRDLEDALVRLKRPSLACAVAHPPRHHPVYHRQAGAPKEVDALQLLEVGVFEADNGVGQNSQQRVGLHGAYQHLQGSPTAGVRQRVLQPLLIHLGGALRGHHACAARCYHHAHSGLVARHNTPSVRGTVCPDGVCAWGRRLAGHKEAHGVGAVHMRGRGRAVHQRHLQPSALRRGGQRRVLVPAPLPPIR